MPPMDKYYSHTQGPLELQMVLLLVSQSSASPLVPVSVLQMDAL